MSSYYGIVFPEFWTGETGRAIQAAGGKDAQVLALYQMSCRHATMIGLYPLAVRDVRHETGLGLKAFVRACTALAQVGFSVYDAGTEHVWVREMAKFRLQLQKRSPLDADDNRVAGVQKLYDRLVDNPFLGPFFDRYAKEVRLKKKRACGLAVVPPQDLAPSKGLIRGSQGACKPGNRSSDSSTTGKQESENRGSEDQNKPPQKSRRDTRPVENSNAQSESQPTPDSDPSTAEHREGRTTGGPEYQRQRVEVTDQRDAGEAGVGLPGPAGDVGGRDVERGDGIREATGSALGGLGLLQPTVADAATAIGPTVARTLPADLRIHRPADVDAGLGSEPAALRNLKLALVRCQR